MNDDAKMMIMLLAAMPVKMQVAICMSILNSVAVAQNDNPEILKHGFVMGDDPVDNITSFLAAMKSACGPAEQVGEITV